MEVGRRKPEPTGVRTTSGSWQRAVRRMHAGPSLESVRCVAYQLSPRSTMSVKQSAVCPLDSGPIEPRELMCYEGVCYAFPS